MVHIKVTKKGKALAGKILVELLSMMRKGAKPNNSILDKALMMAKITADVPFTKKEWDYVVIFCKANNYPLPETAR